MIIFCVVNLVGGGGGEGEEIVKEAGMDYIHQILGSLENITILL